MGDTATVEPVRKAEPSQVFRLDFGGAVWEMRCHLPGFRVELDDRTREFLNPNDAPPDAVVDVEWSDAFSVPGPVLFDAGLWRAHADGDNLFFDFFTERLGPYPYKRAIFDSSFNSGRVLLNRQLLAKLESYYPLEYPLDELASMHRLARGAGVELHSCGLAAADRRGYLFVGHSGAGKSTLGKAWVKHRNATILSDDRIIVTRANDSYRIHGTPWHGEAGLAKNANACLRAIYLIQHGERNEITPLKAPSSAAELLSRSFVPWYRPNDLSFTLSFLDHLVKQVPVYVFRCLPDVSAIEFLEREHGI
jgi:hypothetical protein